MPAVVKGFSALGAVPRIGFPPRCPGPFPEARRGLFVTYKKNPNKDRIKLRRPVLKGRIFSANGVSLKNGPDGVF